METTQDYLTDLLHTMQMIPIENVDRVIEILHEARMARHQVFVMGNGGSAATASHFVCDLLKNTRETGYPSIRAIGLSDNMATLTALANDEGYENVFAEQLAALAQPEDILIAISTSGNSPNVLEAVKVARDMGVITIGFTGRDGGLLGRMVHLNVLTPNSRADQTEDLHLILSHTITASLKDRVKPVVINLEANQQLVDSPFRLDGIQKNGNGHAKLARSIRQMNDPILEAIDQLSDTPSLLFESPEFLGNLLCTITGNISASSGSIAILDDDQEIINSASVYQGEWRTIDAEQMSLFLRSGLAGWVVQNQKSALLTSTRLDSRWLDRSNNAHSNGYSVISIPGIWLDKVIGVITISRPESQPFEIKDLLMLTGMMVLLITQVKSKVKPLG